MTQSDQRPPVVRAYQRMHWGVEFLKDSLHGHDRSRLPTPWTTGIGELVRKERTNCELSLPFCKDEHRSAVEQFIADQEALEHGIGLLHDYCSKPDYGVIEPIEVEQPVAETWADLAPDPYVIGFNAALKQLKEQYAPIRQALAACRYTARQVYPEFFNVPMVDDQRRMLAGWAATTASLPHRIADAA